MAAHFLIYQTEQGAADQLSEFFRQAEESQSLTSWSATRSCIPKNLAFFYFAKPTGAIIAVARASSQPERRPKGEGWKQKRTHAWFCSFTYGELGAGYIEMHHLKLLAGQGARESTLEDVTVVCANCHRILHRRAGEPMDYLQLKQQIARRPKKR